VASLAGATVRPAPYPVLMRHGGFGGAAGLRAWLVDHRQDAVIDATHPFAARISAAAAEACAGLGLPLLRLDRPAWRPGDGDDWTMVANAAAAAAALPPGAVAFLATGPGSLGSFRARGDIHLIARFIDRPAEAPPPHVRAIIGRPPFTMDGEIETLRAEGATHLVCKNAGGAAGRAKLDAARMLGLPVVMIARPPPVPGVTTVGAPAAALDWLEALPRR
jgi:precorrin-6A/cobalt-precorrin-6A reductase